MRLKDSVAENIVVSPLVPDDGKSGLNFQTLVLDLNNSTLDNYSYNYCYERGHRATVTATNSKVLNSYIDKLTSSNSTLSNLKINDLYLQSGTTKLDGTITVSGSISGYGILDGNGHTVTLDLMSRSTIDDAVINVSKLRNSEIALSIKNEQFIGTYAIATNASNIGQGDS